MSRRTKITIVDEYYQGWDGWGTPSEEDLVVDKTYMSRRKAGKPLGPGAPHLPNKQEAKELRRLMQKSGESAEAVRTKLANRRKLAEAQKSAQKRANGGTREQVLNKRLRRNIAATLGVQSWDKAVDAEIKRRKESKNGR